MQDKYWTISVPRSNHIIYVDAHICHPDEGGDQPRQPPVSINLHDAPSFLFLQAIYAPIPCEKDEAIALSKV